MEPDLFVLFEWESFVASIIAAFVVESVDKFSDVVVLLSDVADDLHLRVLAAQLSLDPPIA